MRKAGELASESEALRRAADRFGQALRAARAGAWEWNVGTQEAFWSDENYRIMGLDPDETTASYETWLSTVHPDDRAAAERAVQAAVDEGSDLDIEFRVVLPDGRTRWIRDVGKMVTDPEGNPVAMYGIQMDVTERRLADQARRSAEEQLGRAQRMEAIGSLAGGVAHDFNNLLTVILAAADSLGRRLPAYDGSELTDIVEAAQRATQLTRQLVSLSRREAAKPRGIDLNTLIEQLVPIIRRAIREDLELDLRLGSDVPPVLADPAQMDQLLMNLVINARDAMPEGGVLTIETTAIDEEGAPRSALLVVRDTGVGMDAETAARAFDPFFSTKGAGRGSGLGLATVYRIVSQGGGTIDLQTASGEGARFRIVIPAAEQLADTGPAEPPDDTAARPGAVVLLVEDDAPVRRVAERALQLAGYRVLAASDAREAEHIVREHGAPIDVVLSDVVMPGLSGVELAERLLRARPGLRVVFMSGYASEELTRRGVSLTTHFLEKPFTANDLVGAIERALS